MLSPSRHGIGADLLGGDGLFVDADGQTGDVRPVVHVAHASVGRFDVGPGLFRLLQQAQDLPAEPVGMASLEGETGDTVQVDLRQTAALGGHQRHARSHRLESDDAERFVDAWRDEDRGELIELAQVLVVGHAEEPHAVLDAAGPSLLAQFGLEPAGAGDDDGGVRIVPEHLRRRLYERLHPLFEDETSDEKDDRAVGEPVLLAQCGHVFVAVVLRDRDRVRHDAHLRRITVKVAGHRIGHGMAVDDDPRARRHELLFALLDEVVLDPLHLATGAALLGRVDGGDDRNPECLDQHRHRVAQHPVVRMDDVERFFGVQPQGDRDDAELEGGHLEGEAGVRLHRADAIDVHTVDACVLRTPGLGGDVLVERRAGVGHRDDADRVALFDQLFGQSVYDTRQPADDAWGILPGDHQDVFGLRHWQGLLG